MQDPRAPRPFTDILPPEAATDPDTHYVRVSLESAPAHPDAVRETRDGSSTRTLPRTVPRTIPIRGRESADARAREPRLGPESRPLERNRTLVLAVVRHRLLSLEQLARSHFPGQAHQVIGRRVGRLVADGWLETWDQPVPLGGRPRFVLPTARALRFAYHALEADARGTVAETLLRTMRPARPPKPLALEPGATPPFFQHQKETNDLALAIAHRSGLSVTWSSTWERPLPVEAGGITLPQPDAVFLIEAPAGPRVILLEHDRGMEPVRHFYQTKTARYADLLARPELCTQLFGTTTVEIWVSVLDARERRPLHRLTQLLATAEREHLASHMRFTLGGWLNAFPDKAVFFPRGSAPLSEDVAAASHPLELASAGWEIPTAAPQASSDTAAWASPTD